MITLDLATWENVSEENWSHGLSNTKKQAMQTWRKIASGCEHGQEERAKCQTVLLAGQWGRSHVQSAFYRSKLLPLWMPPNGASFLLAFPYKKIKYTPFCRTKLSLIMWEYFFVITYDSYRILFPRNYLHFTSQPCSSYSGIWNPSL